MQSKHNKMLKLYPNVIPVKGYNRSLLIDLQKGNPYFVPNDLVDYLEQDSEKEIKEYEAFIIENELGIYIDPELGGCLSPLSINYHPDSKINNVILELDGNSSWNLQSVFNQLDELGTQFMEIRFLDEVSLLKNLEIIQKSIHKTTIESVQILVPFSEHLKNFLDLVLTERFFRLSTIVVYNASEGFELNTNDYKLIFTSQESVSKEHCGNISLDSFTVNTRAYARNRNYNSCFAHKISIDKSGLIRNCPSSEPAFGYVDSTRLQDVVVRKEFRSKWEFTKDKLLVCSSCEFRWICNDCRAFTLDDLENGKPSKCTYNPFISLWAGEENYLSEKECGISFQEGEIRIDEEKLNQVNKEIWG